MVFLKKAFSFVLCLALIFSLSGCISSAGTENSNFLSPPKPSGDMLEIKETLEESVQGKISLKYPTAGEYRSAYILADIMKSGKENFALAFYSMIDSENVSSMHLNLMKKADDDWVSISDVSVAAVGVEKVVIDDLNGDGTNEIAVGWNVFGGVDKSLMVYGLKGVALVPLAQESYTDFLCCDMEEKGYSSLFVLTHNLSEGLATAKLFSFEDSSVKNVGSCLLDGQVTTFYTPVFSKLTNNHPAVFIDSAKGTGTQTEVVYFENGGLKRADFVIDESGTLSTYRNMAVLSTDINDDGIYDIPLGDSSIAFRPKEYSKTAATTIKWCSYNTTGFVTSIFAVMNYTDGYYLEIPVRWLGKVTIDALTESRTYTVSIWDTEKSNKMGEILKIRTVTDTEWDKKNNGLEAYSEVMRNGNLVYIATIGNYQGTEKNDLEEIKSLINIIGE